MMVSWSTLPFSSLSLENLKGDLIFTHTRTINFYHNTPCKNNMWCVRLKEPRLVRTVFLQQIEKVGTHHPQERLYGWIRTRRLRIAIKQMREYTMILCMWRHDQASQRTCTRRSFLGVVVVRGRLILQMTMMARCSPQKEEMIWHLHSNSWWANVFTAIVDEQMMGRPLGISDQTFYAFSKFSPPLMVVWVRQSSPSGFQRFSLPFVEWEFSLMHSGKIWNNQYQIDRMHHAH